MIWIEDRQSALRKTLMARDFESVVPSRSADRCQQIRVPHRRSCTARCGAAGAKFWSIRFAFSSNKTSVSAFAMVDLRLERRTKPIQYRGEELHEHFAFERTRRHR